MHARHPTLSAGPLGALGRRILALGIGLLACAGPAAWAVALPAAVVGAGGIFNKGDPTGINIFEFGVFDHPSALLDGTLHFESAGTPAPSMRASAEIGPTEVGLANGFINGFLRYTVLITGPGDRIPVSVLVDASGHVGGIANAGAAIQVKASWALRTTTGLDIVSDTVEAFVNAGSADQSFGQTHEVTLETNAEYVVDMTVDSRAFAFDPGSRAIAESFVDPIFRFAPGVDPALFSFQFSPGIGNTPLTGTLPEPGTAAVAALALAALARARRSARHSEPAGRAAPLLKRPGGRRRG